MVDADRDRRGNAAGWLWGVLALVVVALLIWWAWPHEEEVILDQDVATELEPTLPPTAGGPAVVTVVDIVDNPTDHVGQPFPQTQVQVAEVPTDRGFWIESEGRRLFAVIIDRPEVEPIDIQPGQSLRIDGGTLRDASHLDRLEGEPLDADTRGIAEQQEVFLVVNEDDVAVLDVQETRTGEDPLESE